MNKIVIVLAVLVLGGCSGTAQTDAHAGAMRAGQNRNDPGDQQNGSVRSILGIRFPNSKGRQFVPPDLLSRMDEELRWAVFMQRVFQVPLFRGTVDFRPSNDEMVRQLTAIGSAEELVPNLADASADGREWLLKQIEKSVKEAHEHRLKASAEVFKLLPPPDNSVKPYDADSDLLSGK